MAGKSTVRTRTNRQGTFRQTLQSIAAELVKTTNDDMQDIMREVRDRARDYVPFEAGNMERAIKITSENRRRRWVVYVDSSMPDDTGRYTVGDYLAFLHEGSYKLGKGSVDKANALGVTVGPKFLERAFKEIVTPEKLAEMARSYQDIIANRRRARRQESESDDES